MNLFMGLLTDPFIAGRGDGATLGRAALCREDGAMPTLKRPAPRATPMRCSPRRRRRNAFEQRWSVWAAGFGGSQTTDGNAALGSNDTTSQHLRHRGRRRLSLLADHACRLRAGRRRHQFLRRGWRHRPLRPVPGRRLLRHTVGAAYISAALAYGWQDITTDRTVTVAGFDQLRAEFNANALSGRVEGGYRFVAPWIGRLGITPYAAAQFTTFDLPAYAEQAHRRRQHLRAGLWRQERHRYAQRTRHSHRQILCDADGILTLRGRLAWAHDLQSRPRHRRHLPGAARRELRRQRRGAGADSALTTASAEMKWINGWSAAATFEGEFSDVTRSYAGKGVVRYTW